MIKTILGISCYYHDAAACLIINGKIIAAAQEERFTRKKHDNSFPINAIKFCLSWANILSNDIDAVVFYEKPVIKFERIIFQYLASFPKNRKIFIDTINQWLSFKLNIPKTLRTELNYTGKIFYVDHHMSHASSAYNLSGFSEAVILTVDGVGEWATTAIGIAKDQKIVLDEEIRFPHSLGLLYSTITAYLGFSVNDAEYKVMGLAAYGDPKTFKLQYDELIKIHKDGSYSLNLKYFSFIHSDKMYNHELEMLFGYPARQPESKIKNYYADIALQMKLEEVLINLLNVINKKYKQENLCMAGGVALNSVANGKIIKNTTFKNLYIPPDPSDGGCAIGAALYFWCQYLGQKIEYSKFTPQLGPAYSDIQIKDILDANKLKYKFIHDNASICDVVSDLLIKQKIIGWFQGRMEWGPRALGNRSILASASSLKMKDIINIKIKHREIFRPFAPVILKEHVKSYFFVDDPLPEPSKYMLLVYPFKNIGIKDSPATVHVDKTGRLQVISHQDNPLYYDLIKNYYQKTKIPIIINTSFNIRGEPIVCSPVDAIRCFLNTDIDYLMIGSFLVRKIKKI